MTALQDKVSFARQGRRFLHWTQWLLLFTGILALAYVGLTLLNARLYQNAAGIALNQQIQTNKQHFASLSIVAAKEGDALGKIEIPRLGLSVIVLQGTTANTLLLGVGHIAGTALPGQTGNIGIAGHRDTYFRALKDIRKSDVILLQTAAGVAKYNVDWTQITTPSNVGVLAPTTDSALTLVTCYPFYYIGAAPKRFIVHAHRQ